MPRTVTSRLTSPPAGPAACSSAYHTVVYYLIVAPTAKRNAIAQRKKAATDRQCRKCLSEIPVGAKRCMYCTSEVSPLPRATEVPGPRRARHGYSAAE
jgi:hypothetical protein